MWYTSVCTCYSSYKGQPECTKVEGEYLASLSFEVHRLDLDKIMHLKKILYAVR